MREGAANVWLPTLSPIANLLQSQGVPSVANNMFVL